MAGSLDLGYLYDEFDPPTKTSNRRARWVARTEHTSDNPVTLELVQDASDEPVAVEQSTQTEVSETPEQAEIGVQTESASRAFSTLRKDLPQFSRPAKHTVK